MTNFCVSPLAWWSIILLGEYDLTKDELQNSTGVAFIEAENVIVGRTGPEGFVGLCMIAAAEKIDPQTLVADLIDLAGGDVRLGNLQASVPKMVDEFLGCSMGFIVRIWLHQKMRRAALLHLFRACGDP